MRSEENDYRDIIHQIHHISDRHPQMQVAARAAQFAPFQALTGYGDAIRETARETASRVDLDEYEKERINQKLLRLKGWIREHPAITVTYFVPDQKKDGGVYVRVTGRVQRMKEYEHILVMEDGTRITIEEILEIEMGDA
ncbi:YolD-like family protein [Faecalicatena contorta]|uniref:YolD-like family protein n=1 Tax=Faecalicatena contorta TaxID=39482 RepID=UPI001F1A9459|nr:YolD-like family protein [Faecalicatena contorta]MCF2682094.1 hypothetical protein [Faecalicatena contorta]